MPFGRLKKRLWQSRWRDVRRCRKAIWIHFQHPYYRKNDFMTLDVLVRRIALRNHIVNSNRLKMRLCWCRWSDFSWCRKAIRTHFLRFYDVEVHEATVQGMGRPYEVNFATWSSRKTTSWSPLNDVLSRQVAKRNHNRPSVRLKISSKMSGWARSLTPN
jgi:hypothetical protein